MADGLVIGVKFLLVTCGCLFVAAQVMFEYRYAPSKILLRLPLIWSTGKRRCDRASTVDVSSAYTYVCLIYGAGLSSLFVDSADFHPVVFG